MLSNRCGCFRPVLTVDDPDPITRSERRLEGRGMSIEQQRAWVVVAGDHLPIDVEQPPCLGAQALETDELSERGSRRDLERCASYPNADRGRRGHSAARDDSIPPADRGNDHEDAQTGGNEHPSRGKGDAHVGNLSQAERPRASFVRNDYADPRAGKMTVSELASICFAATARLGPAPGTATRDSFGQRPTALGRR
jgi:hypothetical protein